MSFTEILKDKLSGKNFARLYIFTIWSIFIMYVTMWTFKYGNLLSREVFGIVHTIVGLLYGTILASGWNFWFGTTQSSAEKDSTISETVKSLTPPKQ